ncbi:MAG: hypothetical protein JJU33_02220 [Phycisphaerales bacterium]|nr:hypothetical protein [Phycisphaerales bacterium]
MTTQELIESAVLDTMGLLDEKEQAAFDRAFDAAPPQVQAHVRREQTRFADIDAILPDVEPPAELRSAVIEAVREAMADALVTGGPEADSLTLRPSKGVSSAWRLGAVAAVAIAVVLGGATLQMQQEYTQLNQSIRNNAQIDQLNATFGTRFVEDAVFDTSTRQIAFVPAADDVSARVSIFYNPGWNAVRLFCRNLGNEETSQTYRVALVDEAGQVVEVLHRFRPGPGFESREIRVNLAELALRGERLAILDDATGAVLMTTAPGALRTI